MMYQSQLSNIDVQKIKFNKFLDAPFNMSLLTYNNIHIQFKTHNIYMSRNGYYLNLGIVNKNVFIPLTENNDLLSFFNKIDDYFSSNQFKKKLFGYNAYKYKYCPILKNTNNPYIKAKLDISGNINSNYTVTTKVFHDGEARILSSVQDVAEFVQYGSTAKYTLHLHKLWKTQHNNDFGLSNMYGVGIKITEIHSQATVVKHNHVFTVADLKRKYNKYVVKKKLKITV